MKRICASVAAYCVIQWISVGTMVGQYHQPVAGEVVMVANHALKSDAADRPDFYNVLTPTDDEEDHQLDSELQLKKMISYVEPLMAIFISDSISKSIFSQKVMMRTSRETRSSATGRRRSSPKLPILQVQIVTSPKRRHDYDDEEYVSAYGDYASASSYGGGGGFNEGYCDDTGISLEKLLPLLALLALSGLLLFLIAASTTTTTNNGKGTGRRRRSDNDDIINQYADAKIDLLDSSTWLSMVDELWNSSHESDEDDDSCTLKALCRMNRLALEAPGSVGMAVSISSLPLSYLLHRKYDGHGFTHFLDASLMGRNGANCSNLFTSCRQRFN